MSYILAFMVSLVTEYSLCIISSHLHIFIYIYCIQKNDIMKLLSHRFSISSRALKTLTFPFAAYVRMKEVSFRACWFFSNKNRSFFGILKNNLTRITTYASIVDDKGNLWNIVRPTEHIHKTHLSRYSRRFRKRLLVY